MPTITRRSVPALLASASAFVTTALNAGPGIDPVYAAIEAVCIADAAHSQIVARLSKAERAYWDAREALPCPEYGGVTFKTRDEVDSHFNAPEHKRLIASAIREKLAEGAGMSDLAERFKTEDESADVKAGREAARARVHRHMTAYLRTKDSLRRSTGYADLYRAEGIAIDVSGEATQAAISTVPTTLGGAQALALFAAAGNESSWGDKNAAVALRSIATFLSRSGVAQS